MTITDRIIPYYVWFMYGFGTIGVIMGTVNFGISTTTLITVKNIYVPSWVIFVISGLIIIFCTATGYYFEKYAIWKRAVSHQNQNVNPELLQISKDVKLIKEKLGIDEP